MIELYAGIDIGGTNTALGLFDSAFHLLAKSSFLTRRPGASSVRVDPVSFFDQLSAELSWLVSSLGCEVRLVGIGIDSPGRVDSEKGVVYTASNLGWDEVHIREEMSERLNIPVFVEHDVRAFVQGEAAFGAGVGCRDLIGVTIGTGVAAGFLSGGNILRGSKSRAGEIGHDKIDGEEWLCSCGKKGCLETIVSARGISRAAEEAVSAGKIPSLFHLRGRITPKDVYSACTEGDETGKGIYERAGTLLGKKLSTLVYALDPEIILIGGGVAKAGEYLLGPVRQTLQSLCATRMPPLKVLPTMLEEDMANIIGMAHMAIMKLSKGGLSC